MQNYRDIKAWQQAHRVALRIYSLTAAFPQSEKFGLVQQTRRAAVSVAANIAEGSKRLFKRDYVRFLNIAEASLREVDYYLLLARDLAFVDVSQLDDLAAEVEATARILAAFRKAVQRAHRDPQPRTPDDTPDA